MVTPGSSIRPLRLGIVGGHRGAALARAARRLPDRVEVAAICDTDETVRDRWVAEQPGLRPFGDLRDLLDDTDIDAVVIATPYALHTEQSIAALAAGKHVFSEVLACATPDEGIALIEAADRSDRVYMMAENCCYTRQSLLVQNLAALGIFGTLTYARGGYLHDTRDLLHSADGSLTWRGQNRATVASVSYPTHAIGPLMHWVAAANGPKDVPVSLVAASTPSPAVAEYFHAAFGPDHPGAAQDFWRGGDGASTLITTASGTVIDIRVDGNSPRPHTSHTTYHELQGSKGLFLGSRAQGDPGLVWFEQVAGPHHGDEASADGFRSLDELAEEYEHPLWREWFGDTDVAEGHHGGDFLVMERFIAAVEGSIPTPVDVRASVAWSLVAPLSARSIAAGGAPVEFPSI